MMKQADVAAIDEIADLKSEINTLRHSLESSEKAVENLLGFVYDMRDSKIQDYKKWKGCVDYLKTEVEIKVDRLKLSEKDLGAAEERLKLSEKKVEKLQDRIKELEETVDGLETELDFTEDEEEERLKLSEKKVEKLEDRIKELEETVDGLETELDFTEERLKLSDKEVEKLQDRLEAELDFTEERLKLSDKEVQKLQKHIKELEGSVDDLKTEMEVKEDELETAEVRLKLTDKEVEKLQDHIKELEGTVDDLEIEMEIKEDELGTTEERLKLSEKKVEKLLKAVDSKNRDIRHLERIVDELEIELKIKRDEVHAWMETGEELELAERVIAQLEYHIDEKNIYKLEGTVDDLKTELKIKEDEINTLMEKLTSAEVKNSGYQKEVEMLARDNNFLQELNGSLSKEFTTFQVKMASEVSEKMDQIDTLNVEFKEEFGALESRIYEISNEVKDVIKWNRIEKDGLKKEIAILVEQGKDDGFVWI